MNLYSKAELLTLINQIPKADILFIIISTIIYIISAFITKAIAKSKNRPHKKWFWWSLIILGPLSIIILAFLPKLNGSQGHKLY